MVKPLAKRDDFPSLHFRKNWFFVTKISESRKIGALFQYDIEVKSLQQ
jgi:hypothetical protein